ncbi:MAG: M28 family peptidase, partial [Longimicrobiales bacterium]
MQAKRATTLSVLCAVLAAASCRGNGTLAPAPATTQVVRSVVGRLDVERYKATILGLTVFGDRMQGTQRNLDALNWIEAQLKSYGYANVERHRYTYRDSVRENIYATKVGTTTPGEMYIVSAHMDGRGGGEAADDDASGVALVLELARLLGS